MTKHTTMLTEATQLVPNSSQNSSSIEVSLLLVQRKRRFLGAVVLCVTLFGVGLRMGTTTTDTIIIPHGDNGGVSESMTALQLAVTSDYSCATEVQGAGPCCNCRSVSCGQVCDWLLMCDEGYVPVPFYINDDQATRFPETSDYQPHNCHCRGYEDYNGCFCRQARDMIGHSVGGMGIGSCDACPSPSPSPTHSPTTLLSEQTCKVAGRGGYLDYGGRNVDTSKPFYLCFVFKDGEDHGPHNERLMLIPPTGESYAHCWTESIQIHGVNVGCYPSGYAPDSLDFAWKGTSGRGNNNCGDPCTKFDEHYPFDHTCTVAKGVYQDDWSQYFCFQWKDTTKYCWTHTACPDCDRCAPLGFIEDTHSEGWYYAYKIGPPNSERSDLNSCGPPCTEVVPL